MMILYSFKLEVGAGNDVKTEYELFQFRSQTGYLAGLATDSNSN